MKIRPIFRKMTRDEIMEETCYVPRCTYCGKYPRELWKHWFFAGHYCVGCLQDVFAANCRTVHELNSPVVYVNPNGVSGNET